MTNVSNFIPPRTLQSNSDFSSDCLVPTLLLLTSAPEHPTALAGFRYAKAFCETYAKNSLEDRDMPLSIFIYGEAAHIANRLRWLPSDQLNVAKLWQQLVLQYSLSPNVCVATALARGVVDSDNAKRHQLDGENLAKGFCLVGLGELAMALHDKGAMPDFKFLQF